MQNLSRRTFLKGTAATAAVAMLPALSYGRIIGSNDTIRVGCAGLNGRGSAHVGSYVGLPGVEIAYLIDPDTRTYKKHIDTITKKGKAAPKTVVDVRKALEDKDLDAISIATPNHWHSLMTIWACQAGKDVYVEKPMSHNIHEGRVAVDAARKYNRIVQHGTQSRANKVWPEVAAIAKSGQYGKLLVSRGLCYKSRKSIGEKPESPAPAELDFNLWLGPVQVRPHHANLVPYNWHWFWDFGNGDIGNQGVHQMDIARWMIPNAKWPRSVISLGGRLGYKDQGETPNTQMSVMDYGDTLLIFEVRGLNTPDLYGQKVGNILHFEQGVVAGGKFFPKGDATKGEALKKIAVDGTSPEGNHFGNFINCMRSRKIEQLNADIEVGHISSGLGHLANISQRLGKDEAFDVKNQAVKGNDFASETLSRMAEHLKANDVKLDTTQIRVGRKLTFDGSSEKFVGDAEANALLTRNYRAPFSVPEKIG